MHRGTLYVAFACLLAGCSNLPQPNYMADSKAAKPSLSIDALTTHIRCELERDTDLDKLATNNYVAAVTLTLKVEDNGGATPTLAFLDAGANFTHLLDLAYNVDREQIFTTSYTLDATKLKDERAKHPPACVNDQFADAQNSLSGDLGLKKVIRSGLDIEAEENFNTPIPPDPSSALDVILRSTPDGNSRSIEGSVMPAKPKPSDPKPTLQPTLPTFGTTVQFTVLKSFDTGPNWVLSGFTGPSGTNKGMLNYGRTNTDTLVIAFTPSPSGSDQDKAAAAAKAQNFTTNVILQNLTNTLK